MLFSVIVPIYNVEKYLQQCVDSILSQTFTDFELILVDDGSPDQCPQLCDAYAQQDARIVVIHKENGGLSDARNAGIRAARGEYAVFVDSDDFYATNTVFASVAEEIAATGADVVQFRRKWFYEGEQRYVEEEDSFSIRCSDSSPEEIIRALTSRKMIYFSACLNVTKISHLDKQSLYFMPGIRSEDIEWGFRLFATKPRISLLPDAFYIYRARREGSITSTTDVQHLVDYCTLLERSIAVIEHGEPGIQEALLSHAMYHVSICAALIQRIEMPRQQKRTLHRRLKTLCAGRMEVYTLDQRVKKASLVYRLLGYSAMALALGFYLKHRKTGEHSFKTKSTPAVV